MAINSAETNGEKPSRFSSTQKFIIIVFGVMVVGGLLSALALYNLNASQVPLGASTPNPNCTRQMATPAPSGGPSAKTQTYLDSDFYGCQSIGMNESAGVAYLVSKGLAVRVAARDGINFVLTADYSESRVNLTIEKNVITDYNVG